MTKFFNDLKYQFFLFGNFFYKNTFPLYFFFYSIYKRISDKKERRISEALISEGMVVVDVGANVGLNASFYSTLVGASGIVYAFEPDPTNYYNLTKRFSGASNIIPIQAAVSDSNEALKLYISDDLNVDHCTYDSGEGRRSIPISSVRLDDYFPQDLKIDFLKIDVQGYEFEVLKGVERRLSKENAPVILFEFSPHCLVRAGCKPDALIKFLSQNGYHLFDLDAGDELQGWDKLDCKNPLDYCNILALKSISQWEVVKNSSKFGAR